MPGRRDAAAQVAAAAPLAGPQHTALAGLQCSTGCARSAAGGLYVPACVERVLVAGRTALAAQQRRYVRRHHPCCARGGGDGASVPCSKHRPSLLAQLILLICAAAACRASLAPISLRIMWLQHSQVAGCRLGRCMDVRCACCVLCALTAALAACVPACSSNVSQRSRARRLCPCQQQQRVLHITNFAFPVGAPCAASFALLLLFDAFERRGWVRVGRHCCGCCC